MKRDVPFKFDQSSDLGRWRAETFWDKEPETIAWVESFRELSQENLDFIDFGKVSFIRIKINMEKSANREEIQNISRRPISLAR